MRAPQGSQVIGIAAGDAIGDELAAHLIRALAARHGGLRFVGVCGPKMEAAGAESLFPLEEVAPGAPRRPFKQYWNVRGVRLELRRHFLRQPPALFIGVGAPDLNLDLEIDLRQAGIPTVQYVAPAVNGTQREHITKVKRAVTLLLTLFPFETRVYDRAGVPVRFVGHPLADLLADLPTVEAVREELRLPDGGPVIALLPGADATEGEAVADLFVRAAMKVADRVPGMRFLAPFVSREAKTAFESALIRAGAEGLEMKIMIGHELEAMAAADAVLVASGSAALEAALLRRPVVIARGIPRRQWRFFRKPADPPFASMPNILAGEKIAPECLEDDATPEKVAEALLGLLTDRDARTRMQTRFDGIRAALRQNTEEKATAAIMPLLARPVLAAARR
ncbi:MAG: lipid-A-disaccharide synthase [Burkholderiales bacterium]